MSELRWHPLLREWVITATERQDRTFLPPPGFCPLCPRGPGDTIGELPLADFGIAVFENRFPSLRPDAPPPAVTGTSLSPVRPADGACEVVVYSPSHDASLISIGVDGIEELIWVWRDRYTDLGSRPEVDYVYIFENRGEAIGVTLHHPHGQIYAFPFVPPREERELESLAQHRAGTGGCLVCDVVAEEVRAETRVIASTADFVAAIPFFARWPYEVHVWPRQHRASLKELTADEIRSLAAILHEVVARYDGLWQRPMPYMMIVKQLPTDGRDPELDHLRIEFYPPMRTEQKLKYLAGVESGAGCFINDTLAEAKAAELRGVILGPAE